VMTRMKDNDIPWGKNAVEIIRMWLKIITLSFIIFRQDIQDNRALILGSTVSMKLPP
jgi:muramoyltetrapeptide carboxypeptidase